MTFFPSISNDTSFQTLTNTLLGLPTSGADTTKAAKLWQEFLTKEGLTNAMIEDANPTTLATYKTLYSSFLAEQLAKTYEAELSILQTTNTQEERDVIFKTFTIVLHMLSVLQKTMQASSDALVFYTKVQQQYTELLKKITLYTSLSKDANGNVILPTSSLDTNEIGKTKLTQYGNITISDVLNTLLNDLKDQSNRFSTTKTVETPTMTGRTTKFTLTYDNTNKTLTFTCIYTGVSPNKTFATGTMNVSGMSINDITAQAATTLLQSATAHISTTGVDTTNLIFAPARDIMKPATTADNSDETKRADLDKARQSLRAEANAQLQIFLSNAQANRDLAQSQSKPIENVVNQVRESIQGQITLLNNMIELLKGLIGAVTRG